MSNDSDLAMQVVILRIITMAMVTGVVMFGLIAVFGMNALEPEQPGESTLISSIAGLAALVAFGLHLLIPNIIAQQSLKDSAGKSQAAVEAYRVKHIVALAILEGAAFLNIVACISEHQWWSLALAGGLVFWMLARFPNRGMIENWIASQQN